MIDTIRFKIRISSEQYDRIKISCLPSEYFDKRGEMKRRLVGKVSVPPFNAEMTIMIFSEFPNILYLEGSLPKLWYGENVHLFYANQLEPTLEILYQSLFKKFESFPDYSVWEIQRLDVCYAWKFSTPEEALKVMEYVQSLEYLRKIKTVYPGESVDFVGGQTKVKFYLKGPEYKKHGFIELMKKEKPELAKSVLELTSGVLRFEVTYRRKALLDFFKENRSIRYERFIDDSVLADLMLKTFSNFTANIDKEVVKLDSVVQALMKCYKANKAIRLLCWYNTFILSRIPIRNLIRKYANSSDISANKRDLELASVLIPTMLDVSPFKFPIPSTMTVNPPFGAAAVAATAEGVIREMNRLPEEQLELPVPL